MPSELRREKIENLLREELAKILDRDIEFPGRTIVTVTRVKSSVDGHYANAYVSILGADPAGALAALKKTIYHIQKRCRGLRLRLMRKNSTASGLRNGSLCSREKENYSPATW
ncbi:MAG: hypothetical protein UY61_C0038G0004 [Candidatus Adlerbacteria bacterium GW2011_GWC1_50_9]|uniref:Ribosome-binding factor A n=1 Tax=Candidatus Adlerbacteria bacterium GW2011_GWC1_50_9 TaxID=1618608 RepID=A0A0G1WN85_9BACT|nr:MAG: hypothetical protein UY61_C0038G0004 [Candidatus Adlerbacteria bacterium GW2011_GWC1_50_9]